MFAINFYPELYESVLKEGRKTVTIRLGDKACKYQSGQVVWLTVGHRFSRRTKLYSAVLDRVEVKPITDLSPRDISRENSQFRTPEDVRDLLERIHDRPIALQELVTVIYFSAIDGA